MAILIYGESTEGSASGLTGHYRRSYTISDINSKVRSNIPKYSKINSVKFSFDAYQTIALGSTKADGKIGIGADWDDLTVTVAGGESNVPKGSWTTISKSTTNYNVTSGATAGQFKSTYNSHSIHFFLQASVVRTMKLKNTYITFDYTAPTYTISLSANNDNYGTVSGSGTWDVGVSSKSTTITATPKSGYYFVKWSDGNTSASRSISINQNDITAHNTTLSLTAEFAPNRYFIDLNATPTEGGIVIGGGSFNYLESTIILAVPNEGYRFKQWNDGNTEAERTITVTSAASYTAEFVKNKYTITVNATNDNAIVSGSGEYDYGEEITISVLTVEGCEFRKWNDGATEPTRTIVVTEDATYTAEVIELFQIIADFKPTNLYGSTTGSGWYEYGAEVTLTALPEEGYNFLYWEDGVTEATRKVTCTGNATYIAVYEAIECTITIIVTPDGAGFVTGGGKHKYGDRVSLSVAVNPDYKFIGLYDENGNKVSTVIHITGDATYTAIFERDVISKLYVANKNVKDIFLGNTAIKELYIGNTKIFG